MSVNYSKYFPILDYYEKIVKPINPRHFKISSDKMMCPFHADKNPSLGIIRKKSGEEIGHCFGCHYVGDIVKIHQDITKNYMKRYIPPEESIKELCSIFGVDFNTIPIDDYSTIEDRGTREEALLMQAMEDFDIGDFRYMLQQGKRENKSIVYFNTLLMMMIDKFKDD